MPPKKKAAVDSPEPKAHETTVDAYKSVMMNTTLYEAYCNCGWWPPRFFTKAHAEREAKRHAENN